MKIVKKIAVVLLVLLIGLQLYRPEKNDAEYRDVAAFVADTQPTAEITAILETKCYDCHSDKTTYPWYAEVAPISLWIHDHVEEGNEHLNFSKWEGYSLKKKDHKLDELIEEVEEGEMPLSEYTWTHGNLSEEEKEALIQWTREVRKGYAKQLSGE
ncbi:heme-binding domain-containing protein [Spongiimicrobium salis]|uniref:heme-binding domain-containing protein n=1 Tax=Spongiimicrobium salis TaxID=1667022 RepID=UPI00374CA947